MSDPAQMPAIGLCDQRGGISQIARREAAMAHAQAVGFHGELSMSFNRIEFVGYRPFNLCAGPHSMLAMFDIHILAAAYHSTKTPLKSNILALHGAAAGGHLQGSHALGWHPA